MLSIKKAYFAASLQQKQTPSFRAIIIYRRRYIAEQALQLREKKKEHVKTEKKYYLL